jgi:nitrogen fixation-related uncharacterized protein
MTNDTTSLMLLISAFISISMLIMVIALFKNSYFKDLEKSFESPLCDSLQDLNNAIDLENKQAKAKQAKKLKKT